MHSGAEQTSLWEQSDLLDLAATAAAGDPERPHRAASDTISDAPGTPAAAPADAAALPPEAAPGPGPIGADSRPHAPDEPGAASAGTAAAEAPTLTVPASPAIGQTMAPSSGQAGLEAATPAQTPPEADATPTPPSRPAADTGRDSAARDPAPEAAEGSATPQALPACPQRLLILDTETTALSPQQGQCIEVGAVLFDVASRSVLMQVSFLMPCSSNPAEHVNGIPAAVSRLQQPWRSGLACFEAMVAGAEALLAHNAAFDRQWFGSGDLPALDKPWICSMEDIRWPAERQLRATPSVRDLALAYGVPVWAAHRALTDCIYLVQVFQRCEDLEPLLQAALEPRRLVRARLSYDERQLAKDAGFRWNEPVPKAWSRRLSEREIAALPFAVDPVEAEESGRQRRSEPQPLWRRSA